MTNQNISAQEATQFDVLLPFPDFFLSNSPNEILETRKKIAYFKHFFFAIWMVSNFSKYKINLAVRIFVKLSQDGLVC